MANITIYPFGVSDQQIDGIVSGKVAELSKKMDLLADWAFRDSPNSANPLWLSTTIVPSTGGVAMLRLGLLSSWRQYFLTPLIDLGGPGNLSVTFDCGALSGSSTTPCLLIFDENMEYGTYYKQTVRDRTVALSLSSDARYARLCIEKAYFLDSYLKVASSDEYLFKGDQHMYMSEPDTFFQSGYVPASWKANSRGDFISWNFNSSDEAQTAQRTLYEYPMYRQIGMNAVPYSYSISKMVKLPESSTVTLEFSCGVANENLILRLLNPSDKTAGYSSASAIVNTVEVDTSIYTHVQLYFLTANYADCYIKDATNNVVLWEGSNSII